MSTSIQRIPSEGTLSLGDKVVNAANQYLNLNGRYLQVLNRSIDAGASPALEIQEKTHWVATALKVVSYFTLILPLIALIIIKLGNRGITKDILNKTIENPNQEILFVKTDRGEIKVPWNENGCLGIFPNIYNSQNNQFEIDLEGKGDETVLKLMHFQRQNMPRRMSLSKALDRMAVARELKCEKWEKAIKKSLIQWLLKLKKELRTESISGKWMTFIQQIEDPRLKDDAKVLPIIQKFISNEIINAHQENNSSLVKFISNCLSDTQFQIDLRFDLGSGPLFPDVLRQLPSNLIQRVILVSEQPDRLKEALDVLALIQTERPQKGHFCKEVWLETRVSKDEILKLLDCLPENLDKFVKAPACCESDKKLILESPNQDDVIYWEGKEVILVRRRFEEEILSPIYKNMHVDVGETSQAISELRKILYGRDPEMIKSNRMVEVTSYFDPAEGLEHVKTPIYYFLNENAVRNQGSIWQTVSHETAEAELVSRIHEVSKGERILKIQFATF